MTRYFLLSLALTIGCASATPPASRPASSAQTEKNDVEDGSTCADMTCDPGTHCEMENETPACVSDKARAACKPGEEVVDSQSACLQDDAVCYQLDDGRWCTGSSGQHGNW